MISKLLLIALFSQVIPLHLSETGRKRHKHIKIKEKPTINTSVVEKEIFEGNVHYKKDHNPDRNKISAFENDFRRAVAMEGIKYIYKRSLRWRTWRKVIDSNGERKTIGYSCHHDIPRNTTACKTCGLWTIDESPACPYEFFSLINKEAMCGYNYLTTKNIHKECPEIIKFHALPYSCDNPMETTWRFTRDFGAQKYENKICGGENTCEIFTSYLISPDQVIFRMINTTNNVVIYSRIMKSNNTNYICFNSCGVFKYRTRKVEKFDLTL